MIIQPPAFLYSGINNPQFVYELLDPDTKECRYIGKTKHLKNRYKAHLQQSKKNRTYKECWVLSLLKQNKKPIMRVVSITTLANINKVEIDLISGKTNLTNLTAGGDGQSNILQETITKTKITKYKKRTYLKFKKKKDQLKKTVVAYNNSTGCLLTFESTVSAAKYFKSSPGTIAAYCRKLPHYKNCKNHILRYVGQ